MQIESNAILDPANIPWGLTLIVLAYHLYKHKRLGKALENTASNLIGFFMVILCTQLTPHTLAPISTAMQAALGICGGVMNSEAFAAELLLRFSAHVFPVLLLGFSINLLLARFSRARGVYSTGHHSMYMALLTTACFELFTDLPAVWSILISATILGVWEWATVSITAPVLRKVTGMHNTGMANSCACASLIGAAAGKLSGDGAGCDEDAFGRSNNPSGVPVMALMGTFVIYLILALMIGPEAFIEITGFHRPWLLACLLHSLLYGVQAAALLNGIRLLVSGFVGIFWDLAKHAVPDVWIGLDASALISYSPIAWHSGFICCSISGTLLSIALVCLKLPFVPLPSLTSYYFVGGVAGVCGNAYGGRRGARLAGILTGIAATLLIGLMMSNIGLLPELGIAYGETEYGIYGLFLKWFCSLF